MPDQRAPAPVGASSGWGTSTSTRSDAGDSKGLASSRVIGASLAPLARGRMDPSPTKATRPISPSRERRSSWFSTHATKRRSSPSGSCLQHSECSASRGSSSQSRRSASRPRMRRPAAGRPARRRSSTQRAATTTALRSSTSWAPASTRTRPLEPDPRAARSPAAIRAPAARARKSWSAMRRTRLAKSSGGSPASSAVTRRRSFEGAAKGSPCTWSTCSSTPGSSQAPRSSAYAR